MGLGAGLVIPQRDVGGAKIMTVDRGVICERVKELMGGAKGRKLSSKLCLNASAYHFHKGETKNLSSTFVGAGLMQLTTLLN
ncbi:hypothetical protein CFP56_020933 [Quercus suber]|uniref:Uncharacterized protein n=1 Tax=Quercus suber TaxID=58331 RepID=A0AAW0M023_QUESU